MLRLARKSGVETAKGNIRTSDAPCQKGPAVPLTIPLNRTMHEINLTTCGHMMSETKMGGGQLSFKLK